MLYSNEALLTNCSLIVSRHNKEDWKKFYWKDSFLERYYRHKGIQGKDINLHLHMNVLLVTPCEELDVTMFTRKYRFPTVEEDRQLDWKRLAMEQKLLAASLHFGRRRYH